MIAKHVPMRTVGKSDFAGLVKYLTDEQGKSERVGQIRVSNCEADTMKAVVSEVLATQQQNTRAESDKTFHLLVSFRAGESPDETTINAIEERICAGLGYGEHQRVSVVHHDTDNLHIHIAINKIHPVRNTIHDPYQSYRALGELCSLLEKEYGLETDNHHSGRSLSEGRAADMERHSGIESLVSWIRRECLADMKEAQSWSELNEVMQSNGLHLQKKGNGFVIESDDGVFVKASTVARDLSKPSLENRLGPFPAEGTARPQGKKKRSYNKQPVKFRVNTSELYAMYKADQQQQIKAKAVELDALRGKKSRQIDAIKRSNKLRRAAIKLMGGSPLSKKLLYAQAHRALKTEIQSINKQCQKERQVLNDKYRRRAWADWLKKKAMEGNSVALDALRAREAAQELKGNTLSGAEKFSRSDIGRKDNITKKGTVIYRSSGEGSIRDDGKKLQVSGDVSLPTVQMALQAALNRYGSQITVEGSATFKAKVIQAAVISQLPINFTDPGLERRRLQLNENRKEILNERSTRKDRGRTDRGGIGSAGRGTTKQHEPGTNRVGVPGVRDRGRSRDSAAASGNSSGNNKPNVGRIGHVPPPESQNRLRELSSLGVVHLSRGGEMLLPGNVSRDLEQSGAKPDNRMRRGVSRPGLKSEQLAAADKYISERESKRLKGFDIPKHSRYNGNNGALFYAGTRNVEGQALALLQRDDEILVQPIDQSTANRLKRVRIGEPVSVTPFGSIRKSKGKSR